jgi:multifunctional methyltransferase subunit TRM112
MRLLTHNIMRNNTAAASAKTNGNGCPPRITAATQIRVDEPILYDDDNSDENDNRKQREIEFAKHTLPILHWESLVLAAKALGLDSLPSEVTKELAEDDDFLRALYHVLMNVHLINGMLTCSETGREFPVTDGIVNMMLEESECE